MAKTKTSLNAALSDAKAQDVQREQPPAEPIPARRVPSRGRPKRIEQTMLVGGQLPLRYGRSLKLLAAETGKSNRELLEEALDMLFVAKGAKQIKI